MIEHRCRHCGTALDFQNFVLAANPWSIRCKGCEERIHPALVPMSVLVVVLLLLVYFGWTSLAATGMSVSNLLLAVLVPFVGVEYLLFEALRRGWFPSDMSQQPLVSSGASVPGNCLPAVTPEQVMPMLKTRQWLDGVISRAAEKRDSVPYTQPLVADLVLAFGVDTGKGCVALSPAMVTSLGLDGRVESSQLRALAERNALPNLTTLRQSQLGRISKLACDLPGVSVGLLFPALWDQIVESVGGEVLVAVVHRDQLWFVREDDAQGVAELRQAVAEFVSDDAGELSRNLFIREDGDWELYTAF